MYCVNYINVKIKVYIRAARDVGGKSGVEGALVGGQGSGFENNAQLIHMPQ